MGLITSQLFFLNFIIDTIKNNVYPCTKKTHRGEDT